MTYYLKYRPKNIDELDLIDVKDQLLRIVKSGDHMPHAFLFAGPRGAGKTSAARILAKAVNCESPEKNGEPCNDCPQCKEINKGASLDIIELDAASNRGVDDMRSLRDTVSLAPSGAKKKVYIIDEAHMLTTEASNALLKTLEEPPAHALFVLATTAPEKLLDTIKSRCLTIVFRKEGIEEIVKSLEKVVEGEKLEIEKSVLEEIAKRVDGSFREAHKTLEQLSIGKKKLTLKDLDESRIFSRATVEEFIKSLSVKDTKAALQILQSAADDGVNMKNFSVEVVTRLRESLLTKLGVMKIEGDLNLTEVELQNLTELFSDASSKIASSVIPSLPLELAVVRWGGDGGREQSARLDRNSPSVNAGTGSASSRSSEDSKLDSVSQNLAQTSNLAAPIQTPAPEKGEIEKEKEKDEGKVEALPASLKLQRGEPHAANLDTPKVEATSAGDNKILDEKWKEILALLKPKNFSIEALLRAARPAGFDGENLHVEVFYGFHKERLEKDQYKRLVEDAACEILGCQSVRLVCVLSTAPKKALDFANVTDAGDENILEVAEKIFGGEEPQSENLPN